MLQRQQFCSLHMRRAAFGVPPHQDSQRLWRLQVLLAPQASQNFRLTLRCSFSAAFMSNIFLKDSRSEREAIDSRVTSGPRPNRKSKDAAQKYSDQREISNAHRLTVWRGPRIFAHRGSGRTGGSEKESQNDTYWVYLKVLSACCTRRLVASLANDT